MKIEIDSEIGQLTVVEQIVDDIFSKISVKGGDVYANILIGVTEAVKNAIVHGNEEDNSKKVTITYDITDSSVLFTVADQGFGFNYHSVPDPTLPDNIEKENGRGIFLMNSLADEVIYNDKGTEVSLKFYID